MSWSAPQLNSKKSVPRNRWARSVPFHLDSDVYTLDLEKGYQPHNLNNTGLILGRKQAVYGENEEFSGMGPVDTNFNSLTPPAALKVTYR